MICTRNLLLVQFVACILAAPLSVAADKSASPVEKGIELSRDTKLRIVSYNGFWTTIFPSCSFEENIL